MDVSKAVTFVTEDAKWVVKLLIAAVLTFFSFLLIPIPFLAGYSIGIVRNVMNGVKEPLPEWGDDIGKLFMDGLYVIIAQFVYTLPFLILLCVGGAISIGSVGLSELSEELALVSLATSFSVAFCLGLLWLIVLILVTPAIYIQYVRTDDFGACFRFGEVFGLTRDYIGDILIAFAFAIVAVLVIGVVSTVLQIIPILGLCLSWLIGVAAGPWLSFSLSHLYGQIAAKAGGASTEAVKG